MDDNRAESREDEERRCYRPHERLRVLEVEGQPGKIEGLAVPYGQLSEDMGEFRELIKPGAFAKSIAGDGELRADVEHDRRELLARRSKGTLEFREDKRGLWAAITVPDTTLGRDVLENVRNGNLDAMSVSFQWTPIVEKWVTRAGQVVREISEAVLTGVALTAFPAYPQTAGSLALRSLAAWKQSQEPEPEEAATDIDILRRRLDLAEAE